MSHDEMLELDRKLVERLAAHRQMVRECIERDGQPPSPALGTYMTCPPDQVAAIADLQMIIVSILQAHIYVAIVRPLG